MSRDQHVPLWQRRAEYRAAIHKALLDATGEHDRVAAFQACLWVAGELAAAGGCEGRVDPLPIVDRERFGLRTITTLSGAAWSALNVWHHDMNGHTRGEKS